MFTGYKGAAKRLDDIDLPKIGAEIGVGEDEIHAFMDVEAGGSGFDVQGRVKMLFEPHIFYRELGPGAKRDKAVKQGLAHAKWKPGHYPVDSYPRLLAAMKIDERAALRSASWGLGQIMGFNAQAVGYSSAAKMIEAFADDEENQLRAIIAFLKAKGLDEALRRRDWAKIERVYNGGGFKGHYAARMHNAYARWQGIKDTPWNPALQEGEGPELPVELPVEFPAEPPSLEEVRIEPTSAPPEEDVLRTKKKPVLKHRRVWSTIMGFLTGGGALSFAALEGFDWRALAVIAVAVVFLILFFWLIYRREIRAGMFGPEEAK